MQSSKNQSHQILLFYQIIAPFFGSLVEITFQNSVKEITHHLPKTGKRRLPTNGHYFKVFFVQQLLNEKGIVFPCNALVFSTVMKK